MNLLGNSCKRTSSLAIVTVLFLAAIVTATARISFAATSSSGIVIPLYTYPTDGSWAATFQARSAHPNVPIITVINPSNGPGGSSDLNYVQGVKNFQAAGIIVLGYVATGYASQLITSLESQISSYKNWYSVNGIMFDEMSSVQGNESYYSTLNTYVKSLGMTMTMGNPGTSVPSSYSHPTRDIRSRTSRTSDTPFHCSMPLSKRLPPSTRGGSTSPTRVFPTPTTCFPPTS